MEGQNKSMRELGLLARKKRHLRIRKNVIGTPDIPRMSVFRSLHHMYIQFINDISGKTLLSCSTLSKQFKESFKEKKNNKQSADVLGKVVAEMALEKGIKKVVFDRGGYKYHGRIRALADSARKGGLEF